MIVLIATNEVRLLEKTQDPKRWNLSTVSCRQRIQIATAIAFFVKGCKGSREARSELCLSSLHKAISDMLSVLDQEPPTDVWISQNLELRWSLLSEFLYFTGHVGIFYCVTRINYGTFYLTVARYKLLSMNNANKLMPTTQTHEGFIISKQNC